MKRGLRAFAAASVVLASFAFAAACSSFSSGAAPIADDAGMSEAGGSDHVQPGSDAACSDASALADDPVSCGSCGHSCLGGACEAGVCQPFVFATSDVDTVIDLRVDDTRVMWTTTQNPPWTANSTGALFTASLTGMGKTTADASVSQLFGSARVMGSLDVSSTGTFVSFLDQDDAVNVVTNAAALVSSGTPAVRLHGAGGVLYYQRYVAPFDSIYTLDPSSHASAGFLTPQAGKGILDFAVQGAVTVAAVGNAIFGCGGSTCSVAQTTSEPNQPITAFAADDARIYWVSDGHDVSSCTVSFDTTSGAALCLNTTTPLVVTNDIIFDVIVDHGALWATTNSSIYRCPLPAGCEGSSAPFVTSANHLYDGTEYLIGHHLAATDNALFYAASAAETHLIMEVAR